MDADELFREFREMRREEQIRFIEMLRYMRMRMVEELDERLRMSERATNEVLKRVMK